MELFKIFGTVAVQSADAEDALDKVTDKAKGTSEEVDKLGDTSETTSSRTGSAFSKIGSVVTKVGAVMGTALTAAGAAVVSLGKSAIEQYAQYEQLVGGVETLFQDSADTVIQYAQNAYQTAGLSANEYMDTVTSFSASLLQGLGGDTAAAAEIANTAITDMSDNANKMGTDMASIQNAYQGFAKQNYTMLDNLKLGYGGTQEEMARLINDSGVLGDSITVTADTVNQVSFDQIIQAIHVVQTEMGITGTTATEASTTIQGSFSALKASWTNLLTGLTDESQDFDTLLNNFFNSLMTVGDNLLPRISTVLDGVANLVTQLAPKLAAVIPQLVSSLLPQVISGATALINAAMEVLPQLVDLILASLPDLVNAMAQIFAGLLDALGPLVTTLLQRLPEIITQLVDVLLANLPTLINGCVQLVTGIVQALPQIILGLIQALPQIFVSIVQGLITALPTLLEGIVQIGSAILSAIWELFSSLGSWFYDNVISPIANFFQGLWETVSGFFVNLWNDITGIFINAALWWNENVVMPIINFFQGLWQTISGFFVNLWNDIVGVFTGAANWYNENVVVPIVNFFRGLWESVSGFFSNLWNDIVGIFTGIADWFYNNIIAPVVNVFQGLWNSITGIFDSIKNTITGVWNSIWDVIKSVINSIIGGVEGFVNGIISGINFVLGGISDVANAVGGLLGLDPINLRLNPISLPRLAEGGVLERGQVGLLEGSGAEAVVPLEQNTGWIRRVAQQLDQYGSREDRQLDGNSSQQIPITPDFSEITHRLDGLDTRTTAILNLLQTFFPQLLDALDVTLVLNDGTLVAKLAPKLDKRLAVLAKRKGAAYG